eukprot:TRINITY_DN18845_c0_g1_i1.p1 TRINITY_DN18845_c0_g1~~TRINITY_DN18845_c0_g1_i1.p1  ORF type:complete len:439 (-),score=66.94 TRINITY_DN18845_c0_g1_i1:52-1368(-)
MNSIQEKERAFAGAYEKIADVFDDCDKSIETRMRDVTARLNELETKLLQKQVGTDCSLMKKKFGISENSFQTLHSSISKTLSSEKYPSSKIDDGKQNKTAMVLHWTYESLQSQLYRQEKTPKFKRMMIFQLFSEIVFASSEIQHAILDKQWVHCGYPPINRALSMDSDNFELLKLPEEVAIMYYGFSIAIHHFNGRIYIADTGHNRVLILDSNHQLYASLSKPSEGSSAFNAPRGVAISPDGESIVIIECIGCKIHILDQNHQLVKTIREFYRPKDATWDEFRHPWFAAFDSEGDFYVSDRGHNRVLKFNGKGDFLIEIGGPMSENPTGGVMGVLVDENDNLLTFPQSGQTLRKYSSDGQLLVSKEIQRAMNNASLCRGPNGTVIVCDTVAGNIKIYKNISDDPILTLYVPVPRYAAFDPHGRFYVVTGTSKKDIRIY